jgi:hypothetical protein
MIGSPFEGKISVSLPYSTTLFLSSSGKIREAFLILQAISCGAQGSG